jgi:hypothetical protein
LAGSFPRHLILSQIKRLAQSSILSSLVVVAVDMDLAGAEVLAVY